MKRQKRGPVVVDTNVAVVANRKASEPLACAASCAKALADIAGGGLLVIDAAGLIFSEYRRHLVFAGQPGAGDAFFKWLCDNRWNPKRVAQVELEDDPARPGEFSAFPSDPALAQFDRSDRKFVAVARTHPGRPPVLNATDSDWWHYRAALQQHGVTVEFVCGESLFLSVRRRRT